MEEKRSCPICGEEKNTINQRKKEPNKKAGTSISEIVKAATARGMTYGKYVEALEKGIL